MIFKYLKSLFSKKQQAPADINKEIEITDENGKKKKVNKNLWLETELYPYLKENEKEINMCCDALETALEYGVYEEILQNCIKLYEANKDNSRCVVLMFNCYSYNNMYDEAKNIFEEYQINGYTLTANMYYDLALVFEKLNILEEVEKNLQFSFNLNNNNKNTVDKYLKFMKQNSNEEYYYNWLKDLAINSRSWRMYYELAMLEYNRKNDEDATDYILRSLEISKNEKYLYKVAELLKEKKKYVEYENYILPRYYLETATIDFHKSVLDFYLKDNQIEKGLELLSKLYKANIYDENFVLFEKQYLYYKLKKENKEKANKLVNSLPYGKHKNMLLEGGIYTKLFKNEVKQKKGKMVLVLPFTINTKENTNSLISDFVKNIHIYINELIYGIDDINNKALFLYSDLGSILQYNPYPENYFISIKNANPELETILSGELELHDNKQTYDLKIYTYELDINQKIERFRVNLSSEVLDQVINKFLQTSLKTIFSHNLKIKDISDKRFMQYYSDYIDIVLSINSYNKYRIFATENILKYCLKNTDYNKLNMALSLIYLQQKYMPNLKERYKQDIYNEICKSYENTNIVNNFSMVFGGKNEN